MSAFVAPSSSLRGAGDRTREYADAPHPLSLLRVGGERPNNRRAAEKRNELASLHVPSARTTLHKR
jgi:hypothetical protein